MSASECTSERPESFSKGLMFFVCLLMLCLHEPRSISECLPGVHAIYKVLRVLAALIVVGHHFAGGARMIWPTRLFLCFFGWVLVNCFLVHETSETAVLIFAPITVCCVMMLIEDFGRSHRGETIAGIFLAYFAWVGINFLTMIVYPDGLYASANASGWEMEGMNWFLGFKNLLHDYCVVLVGLAFLLPLKGRSRHLCLMVTVVLFVVTVCLGRSGAGIATLAFFAILMLTGAYRWRLFNGKMIGLAYALVFSILMLVQESEVISEIADLMGKDVTFTGRTYIWEMCWQEISSCPWLGHGWIDGLDRAAMVPDAKGAINAHNTILELLFTHGIIGCVLWLGAVICAFQQSFQDRRNVIGGVFVATVCMLPVTLVEEIVFRMHFGVLLTVGGLFPCEGEDNDE